MTRGVATEFQMEGRDRKTLDLFFQIVNNYTGLKSFDSTHIKDTSLHKKWNFPLRISSVNMTKSDLVTFTEETFNGKLHFLFSIFPTINNHYSLRATDRFVQPIFLRIFRCIGAIVRGNGCDICWSAVICMGDSWPRTQSISPNLTSFYPISHMAKFCAEECSKQKDSFIPRRI